jgi:MFS family permease
MMPMAASIATSMVLPRPGSAAGLLRTLVVGLTAFLTVVDLFATQEILPVLTRAYHTTPATMSFAVNASTIGMAISGLAMALVGHRVDRRNGILLSLALLSVPTLLLATMPNLVLFAVLRIVQGLLMAAAFTLTLAYIGETSTPQGTATAFAAYITGNVASNLIGRLVSAAVADHFGLAANFYAFAALNLCGVLLVSVTIRRRPVLRTAVPAMGALSAWLANLRDPALRAAFVVGFCILFAFIGTFTYVNFVLVRQPFALGMMDLGFVYFVFLPSSSRRRSPVRWHCVAARASPAPAGSRLLRSGSRCCCCHPCRACCSAWCCSAWERSSPRPLRRALWGARHARIGRRRAASTLPVISWAVSWAALSSDRSTNAWDGRPASAASPLPCSSQRRSRHDCWSAIDRSRDRCAVAAATTARAAMQPNADLFADRRAETKSTDSMR